MKKSLPDILKDNYMRNQPSVDQNAGFDKSRTTYRRKKEYADKFHAFIVDWQITETGSASHK